MSLRQFFTTERLCLQILHGKLSLFVEKDGRIIREAHAESLCSSPEQLESTLLPLLRQIRFRGERVSIVLSDLQFHYMVVTTPPMKPKDLRVFLTRKAHQEWKEKSPIRFGWSELKVREGKAVLLQIVAESWVKAIVKVCRHQGWQPMHVYTANAAAIHHLDSEYSGTQLLAIDSGSSAFFVVRKNGDSPVLIRELSISWQSEIDGPMRVAQEIQRTQLFAKQQLGTPIDRISLLGKGSQLLAGITQSVIGTLPAANEEQVAWALPLGRPHRNASENLLTAAELSHNADRRRGLFLTTVTLIALIALIASVYRMSNSLTRMDIALKEGRVQETIDQLHAQQEALTVIRSDIESNYALGLAVATRSNRPIPGWIAGVIADLVPDEMVLTQLWVHPDTTGAWNVDIGGEVQRNPLKSSLVLEEFQNRLASIVSHYEPTKSWKITWIENLKYGASWEPDDSRKTFLIQGVMR